MASSVTHISAYSGASGSRQGTMIGSAIYRETLEDRLKQWWQWLNGKSDDGRKIIMGRSLIDWREWSFCFRTLLDVCCVVNLMTATELWYFLCVMDRFLYYISICGVFGYLCCPVAIKLSAELHCVQFTFCDLLAYLLFWRLDFRCTSAFKPSLEDLRV